MIPGLKTCHLLVLGPKTQLTLHSITGFGPFNCEQGGGKYKCRPVDYKQMWLFNCELGGGKCECRSVDCKQRRGAHCDSQIENVPFSFEPVA